MQSGYPQCQEGTFPVFQHLSNTDDLNSAQVSNVPVYCPPNGLQGKMVATQYSVEHSVAYGSSQEQQGNALVQQHFQVLHHQQETQASTGFQRPKCKDRECNSQPSHHQMSKKAHVTEQYIEYCPLSSLNKCVYNPPQERECSDLINYPMQQQRHLNSEGASSVACQGDGHTQSSVSVTNPLLFSLLTRNSVDLHHFKTKSTATANIVLNSATELDGQCKSQQMNSSLAAGNRETHSTTEQLSSPLPVTSQLYAHKVLPVEETNAATDDLINNFIAKKVAYYKTLKNRSYMHTKEAKLYTVQSECNSLTTSVSDKEHVENSHNCTVIEQCTTQVGHTLEEDCSKGSKANSELTLKSKEMEDCTTVASEEHSTEYPQIMMKVAATCTKNEDESPVVLTSVSGMTLDELKEKYSSLMTNCSLPPEAYKSPWLNINSNLDNIDKVPGVSWGLKCTMEQDRGDIGQKSHMAVGQDSVPGVTNVSEDFQTKSSSVVSKKIFDPTSTIENQDMNTKNKEGVEAQHCHSTCREVIEHIKLNTSVATSWEGVRKDLVSMCSQTDLKAVRLRNKVKNLQIKHLEEHSVNILKDPQYEDISDDPPNTDEESCFPPCSDYPQYEDISDDENSQMNLAVETPSLKRVREPNNRLSFENEDYGPVQGQAQMETEVISDEEAEKQVSLKTGTLNIAQQSSCPGFVETEDGLEHQAANISNTCGPSSFLMEDDNWVVIPISMSDLTFESEDGIHGDPEKVVLEEKETENKERQDNTSPMHSDLQCPDQKTATKFSVLEVFDTVESFRQAKTEQFCRRSGVASGGMPEMAEEPCISQNRRESYLESDDSCDTEDSCDYSSVSERNYLTVPRQLLRSATLNPEADDSECEKESEHEATNVQKVQNGSSSNFDCTQKAEDLLETKPISKPETVTQEISEKDDLIIIDSSDTDDEIEKHWQKGATRNRRFSSGSKDAESIDIVKDACSNPAYSAKMSKGLIETNDGCENVQHETSQQNISQKESVVILDSDTEDECAQKYRKTGVSSGVSSGSVGGGSARKCGHLNEVKGCSEHVQQKANKQTSSKRKSFHDSDSKKHISKKKTIAKPLSSASVSTGSALFDKQNRQSTETVNSFCGTANEMPNKKISVSSKDSPGKLPHTVNKEADSNPVVSRLFVGKGVQSSGCLELSKKSEDHRQGKAETLAPVSPTETGRNTDLCEKNASHLYKNRFVSRPKPVNDEHCETRKVQAHGTKSRLDSRQLSLLSPEGPSISTHSSISTGGQMCEPRQYSTSSGVLSQCQEISTFSRLSKFKESISVPRQHMSSSKLKHSHSYSSAPTYPNSPTKAPSSSANTQSSARKQVTNDWNKSFFPTRRDKKISLVTGEAWRNSSCDSSREERPGPVHHNRALGRRHSLYESAPPLMKKTKFEAIQLRKAMTRDTTKEEGVFFSDLLKWIFVCNKFIHF
ncbi:microtubule-associated protein futsch-like isoform X5 [Mastacembelus armatus]|uniref:microtubule-associated protein futsch-like isoform X5 n=1 Tax=Mastacembelus armatus TaxID=205130 RepID=UPI000E4615C6|nr:microtubule-associated protein futsch-like isoform X5 [Mastacembelus armatus]